MFRTITTAALSFAVAAMLWVPTLAAPSATATPVAGLIAPALA